MLIEDHRAKYEVSSEGEVETVLRSCRANGLASLTISHHSDTEAWLSILLTRELAYVYYVPSVNCCGFYYYGDNADLYLDQSQDTVFHCNCGCETPIPNCNLTKFSTAVRIAKEFLHSSQLSVKEGWSEL